MGINFEDVEKIEVRAGSELNGFKVHELLIKLKNGENHHKTVSIRELKDIGIAKRGFSFKNSKEFYATENGVKWAAATYKIGVMLMRGRVVFGGNTIASSTLEKVCEQSIGLPVIDKRTNKVVGKISSVKIDKDGNIDMSIELKEGYKPPGADMKYFSIGGR